MNFLLSHSFPVTCLQTHKVDFVTAASCIDYGLRLYLGTLSLDGDQKEKILTQKLEVTEVHI